MPKIKIKNEGGTIEIGGMICTGGGAESSVDEKAFKDYIKTKAGSYVWEKFLTVIDEDFIRRQKENAMAINSGVESESAMEDRIREEIEKEHSATFKSLIEKHEKEVSGLKECIAKLEKGAKTSNKTAANDSADKTFDINSDFDPDQHHIEHRGAGKWFVMDGEKKVYAIADQDERERLEKIIKDSE